MSLKQKTSTEDHSQTEVQLLKPTIILKTHPNGMMFQNFQGHLEKWNDVSKFSRTFRKNVLTQSILRCSLIL